MNATSCGIEADYWSIVFGDKKKTTKIRGKIEEIIMIVSDIKIDLQRHTTLEEI